MRNFLLPMSKDKKEKYIAVSNICDKEKYLAI